VVSKKYQLWLAQAMPEGKVKNQTGIGAAPGAQVAEASEGLLLKFLG
jgi:hypothetical protein